MGFMYPTVRSGFEQGKRNLPPGGLCRATALMTFKDGLIARDELFFDASPFKKT
jgi:hypothetical protein